MAESIIEDSYLDIKVHLDKEALLCQIRVDRKITCYWRVIIKFLAVMSCVIFTSGFLFCFAE